MLWAMVLLEGCERVIKWRDENVSEEEMIGKVTAKVYLRPEKTPG